jgi:hypothetical protein
MKSWVYGQPLAVPKWKSVLKVTAWLTSTGVGLDILRDRTAGRGAALGRLGETISGDSYPTEGDSRCGM